MTPRRSAGVVRWVQWAGELIADVRYAHRSLAKSPGFTWMGVAMLAIGVGANTAMFGIVEALFLRQPSGVRNAEELIRLYIVRDEGMLQTPRGSGGSYADYRTFRDRVTGLTGTAAFLDIEQFDMGGGNDARQVSGQVVSGNFFALLGVAMAVGRPFQLDEDITVGSPPVAILSHQLWQNQFGGNAAVIGRSLAINGQNLVVVGVAEAEFRGIGPVNVDVWVPMAMAAPLGVMLEAGGDWRERPFTAAVNFIARLGPAVGLQIVTSQASAALAQAAVPELDPTPRVFVGSLVAASGPSRTDAAKLSLWLFAMTGMILVIVCANLANLFLARSTARRREMATRLALGASPGRVVRQVLAESLVMSFLGTAVGLLLVLSGALVTMRFPLPPGVGRLNGRMLGFALFVAILSGAIPALVSALSAIRSQPGRWLGESRTATPPRRGGRRSVLVIVQIALSAILLMGAALFIRSTQRLASVNPGMDVKQVLVTSMSLVRAGYQPLSRRAVYDAARDRLRQIPGVEQVALTHFAPLEGLRYSTEIQVAGQPVAFEENPFVNWVGAGYFETVGTALLRGRGIAEEDRYGSQPVVVVNEALTRKLAPIGDVIGLCLAIPSQMTKGACAQVVGIVQNQRSTFLDAEIVPMIYLAYDQHPKASAFIDGYILVRTREDASATAEQVRAALRNLQPDLPYVTVEPLRDRLQPESLHFRLGALLFTAFGVIALAVAAMGVYSIVSYFVSERRPELAIRQALGATSADIVGLVVRQSMLPVATGTIIGLAVAYAGGGLIEALLFEVPGRDLQSCGVAAALLGAVSLLASIGPAWRGASVAPIVAMRGE
ncbi:MAG: ABC transporter permease [Gemmatimonadales bacterium]